MPNTRPREYFRHARVLVIVRDPLGYCPILPRRQHGHANSQFDRCGYGNELFHDMGTRLVHSMSLTDNSIDERGRAADRRNHDDFCFPIHFVLLP